MRATPAIVLALAVFGCRPIPDPVEPTYGNDPTDTTPQFLGQVPRNLVMISIDTLRKDHVDRYANPVSTGTGEPLMPFLSQLAEQGVALDDHMQCSNWTYASMSCTMAGRYNFEAGMAPRLGEETREAWPDGTPFLASHLGGFYSILASTNGWLAEEWGNTHGYDEWFHPFDQSALGTYSQARGRLLRAQLEGLADRWMLHVHMIEPHASYNPPQDYLGELSELPPTAWNLADREMHYDLRNDFPALPPDEQELLEQHLRARYRAEVRWLDDQLFAIFQDLESWDLLDDALLVVYTDHGEAFWEHGYQTHAYSLHGEENDGVALFWAKNIVSSGGWAGPTSAIDVAPTIAELLTGRVPEVMTGIPLGSAPDDRARFGWTVARLGPGSSIQKGGWKMIFPWSGGAIRLYDRTTDPLEQTNLYAPSEPSDVARELWRELEPKVQEAQATVPELLVQWPEELTEP